MIREMNEPTRIKLVSNKPKVYLLFVTKHRLAWDVVGIYSSFDNAESEVEEGEVFAILEAEVDGIIDTAKLTFTKMEKSE